MGYSEFERAADTLLSAGEKPGLENVRKVIGGSPETIRQLLRRYWVDVAALKRSPAEALKRLPSDIADLADELWQRALTLAAKSATHDDNAARERLELVKRENELRSHALAVKERTLRELAESRDKTMKELQEQVATLLAIVSRNTETIAALQAGKTEAEATAEDYRQRLAQVIARAVAKNQKAHATRRPSAPRAKARKQVNLKRVRPKRPRRSKSKRRPRR